jgi:hypothetical protein
MTGSLLAAATHPPALLATSAALLICPTGASAVKQSEMLARTGCDVTRTNIPAVSNTLTLRETKERHEVMGYTLALALNYPAAIR